MKDQYPTRGKLKSTHRLRTQMHLSSQPNSDLEEARDGETDPMRGLGLVSGAPAVEGAKTMTYVKSLVPSRCVIGVCFSAPPVLPSS